MHKRKLIEVALPLEAINRESAREKSIRHGHPSTLHLWWARRPLAAARAVLFAQLVDDPSARPDRFPTEEAQRAERERLHGLIERLVAWENMGDEHLLDEAKAEILDSCDGDLPAILDPFAGGGTIPLEAQRLGLPAYASDLNPVAVLINKSLIEIPPKFSGRKPVFPGVAASQLGPWSGAQGLSADVAAYGSWLRREAFKKIGHLYPDTEVEGGRARTIAWLWARTVPCPNPACGIDAPLVRSWWLGKKKGKEAYVAPEVVADDTAPGGKRVVFSVVRGTQGSPTPGSDGTMSGQRGGACIACGTAITATYAHAQSDVPFDRKPRPSLMAVVAEGSRQRLYRTASSEHIAAALATSDLAATIRREDDTLGAACRGTFGGNAQGRRWGFFTFADYFYDRQLVALTTLSDLISTTRDKATNDALADGMPEGLPLHAGGDGAQAYGDAIATYLAFTLSRSTNKLSAMNTWDSSPKMEAVRGLFARQAIPMAWDFAEANPFGGSSGDFLEDLKWVQRSLDRVPAKGTGVVLQADAAARSYESVLVSTDPPYYDNIVYSDLSDYFYVWLRRSLRTIYPDLLGTLLVPKADELVANHYRHDGRENAKKFFEDGFRSVFAHARESASTKYPMTVWYAFKQSEEDASGEASTGWETLLEGMIQAGWEITSTWPNRSELSNRMVASGTNALASSIVLSLRPRREGAPTTDRRGFIADLEAELPGALRRLQQGLIAPVDLPQAAIGPGMAVFSRYSAVLEPDGKRMTVRASLSRINEILDQVLSEQEGDFDATTRFALAWYRQHGYGVGKFGDADNLARARNTSVDTMDRDEILTSRAGNVQLIKPADLPWDYDVLKDQHTSNWEALHHLVKVLERDGIAPAGAFLQAALARPDGAVDADLVKELAHLLFRIAEGNGWTKDALSFNALVTSWPEILEVARSVTKPVAPQGAFDFDGGDD